MEYAESYAHLVPIESKWTSPEGIVWLHTTLGKDATVEFRLLPRFVKYEGKLFRKASFNSDSMIANYRICDGNEYAEPAK